MDVTSVNADIHWGVWFEKRTEHFNNTKYMMVAYRGTYELTDSELSPLKSKP